MMRRITHLGSAQSTIAAGLLLAVVDRRLGLAALLANAMSHVMVQVLKRTVRRARPADANGVSLALIDLPDPFSFPSGHAAAAFAVAVPVAHAHPALAGPALAVAALVSWSRVALRVHWPGDALAGAVLGIGGAVATLLLLG